jgi:hypothetical protein
MKLSSIAVLLVATLGLVMVASANYCNVTGTDVAICGDPNADKTCGARCNGQQCVGALDCTALGQRCVNGACQAAAAAAPVAAPVAATTPVAVIPIVVAPAAPVAQPVAAPIAVLPIVTTCRTSMSSSYNNLRP